MRNIFMGFLLCVFCGASFLTLVQSTTFPGSYLTGNSDVEYQRFSDIDHNGKLVNYQFVPLNSVASRVRRQVPPSEQKNADNVKPSSPVTPAKKPTTDQVKPGSVTTPTIKPSNDGLVTTPVTTVNTSSISSSGGSSVNSSSEHNSTSPVTSNSSTLATTTNITISDDADDFFPTWNFNKTVKAPNSTDQFQFNVSESFKYYDSTFISNGSSYWMDLSPSTKPGVEEHELLSNSHRRAATVKLKFKFPFYGHLIENVTVATGGFIYLGEHVHAWLAATQYLAPLMANFDSSKSPNASVRFLSTDNSFTVEWSQVPLQDTPEKGPFTFEASLYENGTIVFAYKKLPINISDILDLTHPVKVGVSDAYIRDKNVLFVKQKTIYEYDRVDLRTPKFPIGNGSAIVFTPKKTCLQYNNCLDCARHDTEFDCSWCPHAGRCSDGTDRYRHDWLSKDCDRISLKTVDHCADTHTYTVNNSTHQSTDNHDIDHRDHVDQAAVTKQQHHDGGSGMGAAGVIGVLVMLIVTAVGWVFYAYIFPHSTSGQLLIRYRPSQWSFSRRGQARYTAASIHM